jgi:hypothetical protein
LSDKDSSPYQAYRKDFPTFLQICSKAFIRRTNGPINGKLGRKAYNCQKNEVENIFEIR